MRISFDLDEVLFVNPENYKIEPPGLQETGQNEKEGNSKGTVKNTVVIRARSNEPPHGKLCYRTLPDIGTDSALANGSNPL